MANSHRPTGLNSTAELRRMGGVWIGNNTYQSYSRFVQGNWGDARNNVVAQRVRRWKVAGSTSSRGTEA